MATTHHPLAGTVASGANRTVTAECARCGEPIKWTDTNSEWHTTAAQPREHYVNVCAGWTYEVAQ
jgi:hypothetical protein